MKHFLKILSLYLGILYSLQSVAQAPQGLNYQSVVRNPSGQILSNHAVSLQFSIHDGSPTGPVLFRETHTVTTNSIGIFSTVIGTGSGLVGTFPGIDWAGGSRYLQVEMDLNGGTAYTDMGTSQFVSVPYAIYSAAAATSASAIVSTRFDTSGTLSITTAIPSTISAAQSVWLTKGNASLAAGSFIGTTDNTDLILKGHNVEGIRLTTGGALLATGSAAGITPVSGAGTRLMWIPAKAAFRAGSVTGTAWDNANIGQNSMALGKDVIASGVQSVAIGNNNTVIADKGVAMGNNLIAKSFGTTVVGSYNDTTGSGSSTLWNAADPLFLIGNGTSAAARATALSVTKGGDVSAPGLTLTQGLTITPGTMTVNGNFALNPGNKSMYLITSTAAPSSANVTMAAGIKVGQMLFIEVLGTGSNGIKLTDNSSYLALPSDISLTNNDTVTLMWDGSNWICINYSNN